jgi:hypothetical protein
MAWMFDQMGLPTTLAFVPTSVLIGLYALWYSRWSGLFLAADGTCWYRNYIRRRVICEGNDDRPTVHWQWRRQIHCLQFNAKDGQTHLVSSVAVVRNDTFTRRRVEAELLRFGLTMDDE